MKTEAVNSFVKGEKKFSLLVANERKNNEKKTVRNFNCAKFNRLERCLFNCLCILMHSRDPWQEKRSLASASRSEKKKKPQS